MMRDHAELDRLVREQPPRFGDAGQRARLALRTGLDQQHLVGHFHGQRVVRALDAIHAIGQLLRRSGHRTARARRRTAGARRTSRRRGNGHQVGDLRGIRPRGQHLHVEHRPAGATLHHFRGELQAVDLAVEAVVGLHHQVAVDAVLDPGVHLGDEVVGIDPAHHLVILATG